MAGGVLEAGQGGKGVLPQAANTMTAHAVVARRQGKRWAVTDVLNAQDMTSLA